MTTQTLHSTASGEKEIPVLLLLNSLGATEAMWEPQLALLERHYRVIRCDTRGHGQSPTPASPYSFDDIVADALGVLDAHNVKTASVMGLSLGGMTALGLGLAAPERIDRVICCAARADAPPPFVQSWHDRLAKMEDGGIEAVWNGTVGFWLSEETRAAHPEREAKLRESFLQTTEEGYRGCAHALMGLDYLRQLGGMTVPTLFVAGENDAGATPETMRAMADACPGSAYTVVPGAKHVINIDRPDDFAVAIMGFLGLEV
ncbi:3-oxoadipate enol-lactonase 2 [Thalassovita gelatinovora]|uniref:3-oxoadipate enol-lactonase 2 n=1 Tax=Thalassovita gelatinovora TaxID=53501 RepID=A0A0P1FJS2_THAGE|nr:alpha/beta fold hydrolase [Thalassovita gelatinovora]QIZ81605.1 alpha/beta fold hydrolase [Thalassovita gelatinovora]CUH68055.1 3-oxoadipate enol-lactonase 2 [Thalassovita gelatinovora]SEQ28400.1 3-oxoadipate enol-lactonase [Thalassovita gelatinovora]